MLESWLETSPKIDSNSDPRDIDPRHFDPRSSASTSPETSSFPYNDSDTDEVDIDDQVNYFDWHSFITRRSIKSDPNQPQHNLEAEAVLNDFLNMIHPIGGARSRDGIAAPNTSPSHSPFASVIVSQVSF
ncbi:hypothetical protein QQZ08_012531 [Neonectria magnoliae]|uniref:Uncharacterized protein n=1 Tax=Neonectria magnoliae TaxID=2732573 RepID=A0ABR1H0D1_9HYPO